MRYIANPAIWDLWDFITDKNCSKQDCTTQYVPVWDGKDWVAEEYNGGGGWGPSSLSWLDDVSISTATNWQILTYSSSTGKWRNSTLDMIDTLAELTDVTISWIENGDTIVYNSTTHKFENKALGTIYKVKWSVADFAHLPATGQEPGDVWNVIDTGANYVWTWSAWDKLSETVDLESVRVQMTEMPSASGNAGKVYQYVGTTTENYTNGYFYESDGSTWTQKNVQPVDSGAGVLQESITSNIAVGWIAAGTTLAAGTSIESIIRQMLVTYITPTLSLAAKSGVSLVNYVGDTVANPQFDVTAVRGSGTFTTVQLLAGSTLSDTQSMTGTTATLTYTGNVTTDTTFKAYVEDNGQTINSNTVTIKFVQGSYFGQVADTVTTPTAADITALTKLKNTTKGYTANNISMTYGKLLYAYPASYGDLTSIKDANNFEYITSYTKSTVTIDGVSYNCYLMTDATGVTGFKQIYA